MYKIDEIKMLRLGQRDENLARDIQMDASDWLELYPGASIQILFRRPGESTITPMISTLIDGVLTWQIHDFEVGKTGVGNAEIRAVDTAGLRRKSRIIPCSIEDTLLGDDETVLYTQDQVDITLAHIGEAAQAAIAAKASEDAAALSAQEAADAAGSIGTTVEDTREYKEAAEQAAQNAQTAQEGAEAAESGVHADAEAAEQAKVAAQAAQASAQGAASQASADRTAAESARADAEAAAAHAEAVVEGIDQAGADQVAAVNAAGATQVGNVNAAGTTQVNAVQAKGTQVIASIPADYSALSSDVTDLKSAIIYQSKLTVENIVTPKLNSYLGLTFDWIANGMLKITGTSTDSINVTIADMSVKSGAKYRWRIFSGTFPGNSRLYLYGVKGSTNWIDAPYEWVENAERTVAIKLYVGAGVTFNDTFCFAVSTEKTNIELENDTNNIFQQINPIAQHDLSGMADNFAIGSIYSVDANGTVNVYTAQKHRICSKKAIKYDFDITITAETGYRFGPRVLENGVYVDKGWKTTYTIPANTYFVLMIGATNDSEYADISKFLTKVTADQILTTIATAFYKTERYNKAAFCFDTAVKSIAHQGLRLYAPANTRPAFIDAKKYGYNFIETDVRTTSDGVIVINHDDNIATTGDFYDITGGTPTLVTTETLISQTTYADLYNNYDIRLRTDDQFAGNKIMTLDDLLILCKKINLHPYIELKYANGIGMNVAKAIEIAEKIKRHGMLKQCTIITSADHLLTGIKNAGYTTIRMGFLNMGIFSANAVNVYNALKSDFNDIFVDVPCDIQTTESIDLAISNNVPLEAYNVTPARLETISPYYTGYTADSVVASTYFYDSVMT